MLGGFSSSPRLSPPLQTPQSAQSRPSTSMNERSLIEVLSESFPQFDHRKEIVEPFTDETNHEQTFKEELCDMLLASLIEASAWSTARLKQDNAVAAERFEQRISQIMDVEKEQGMSPLTFLSLSVDIGLLLVWLLSSPTEKTRERLNDFITRLKNAIIALTDSLLI
ncbi:hypothetical protein AMATHDRAFT_150342 [Amanita thiersii Skay4041]|uniref:Uncharacterized protein n=1 Tax=Amanita thiersii Skay4041 TaxID=703135 RepID=A0A2A9NKK7_9AGAR|nr:hypothetical protein AMATHDRAFT_150342 [Amanita thiersii Skay4041]